MMQHQRRIIKLTQRIDIKIDMAGRVTISRKPISHNIIRNLLKWNSVLKSKSCLRAKNIPFYYEKRLSLLMTESKL